ncbi:MAG: metallophosphoesterase [Planctomycetes bacterium]|nr:metallophosphoesterase [Planctomycetota bacterium]
MQIDFISILLFLMFSVGHTALVIAITNRLHALPMPVWILHRIRQFHDVVIVIVPVLFAWFQGVHGPQLFLSGWHWASLSIPLQIYLGVCGAFFLALPGVAIYRSLLKTPQQLSCRSKLIDVAEELGFRPVGPGPYQFFTKIPGNEFLKLEICEKEFQLPRLPAGWDGLKILHLSDLHYIGTVDRPYFEKVVEHAQSLPADLIVMSGDLLDREDLVSWLPATLGKLSAPLGCYFVLGNHDSYLTNVSEIREHMERLGWHDLAGHTVVVQHQGQSLVLCGSERPWMGTQPDLAHVPAGAFRLFVSHTPDNLHWAKQHDIDLMLAGHNHGGQIRLPWFGPVYSPSAYGAHFASGVFYREPTLLHVSRGIAGRHPLRLNCPPELIRLTLRAGGSMTKPNNNSSPPHSATSS